MTECLTIDLDSWPRDMGSKGLTTVWFQPHQHLSLLRGAGDPVSLQFEAEVSLERWQSSIAHLSRLQLAKAMEALGAATRYWGLDGT